MSTHGETICAIATAPGAGAIGVIRLSGDGAGRVVKALCPGLNLRARRLQLTVAWGADGEERLDELMVAWMPGPRSYTGEDVAELFAHGGELNMERLLRRCLELGARLAAPGEFTRRAFVNGRMDLTQAEAVAAVIEARSTRALRNAQALLAGELGRRVQRLREKLLLLAADLEALIDFADQADAPVSRATLERAFEHGLAELEQLVASYDRRGALGGISVALVGAINAGKSSLFNALLAQRRALVSDEGGTTRDFLEAEVEWSGLKVTLVDTAGARPIEQMSALERAGHQLGEERVARCDLRVGVVDVQQREEDWPAALRDACDLFVLTKAETIDLRSQGAARAALGRWGGKSVVVVSAFEARGLDELRATLLELALPKEGEAETFRITEERQWEALRRAQRRLVVARESLGATMPPEVVVEPVREALRILGELIGEEYSERVLDLVFSRFCIGK